MAHAFAAEGMRLVIADIEPDALDAAAAGLRASGAPVHARVCDVSDGEAVDALAAAAVEAFGAVHVVCNNAGVSGGGLLQDLTTKDWEWILGVNLWGVIHGVRAFLPRLVAQGEGHIVNTASVLGLFSAPFTGAVLGEQVRRRRAVRVALPRAGHDEPRRRGLGALPGWVDTNLHSADRNRPGRAVAIRWTPRGRRSAAVSEVLKGVMAAGMAPADVAAKVVAAVKDRQFCVITHDASDEAIEGRTRPSSTGVTRASTCPPEGAGRSATGPGSAPWTPHPGPVRVAGLGPERAIWASSAVVVRR